MKAIDRVASILQQEGVDHLFCFPASYLIEAAASIGIRTIMTRTERTALAMADGYTRVNDGRRTGVCAVQYGPGIENSFAGMAQANQDGVPILFMPGHLGRQRIGSIRNFHSVPSYTPITKWSEQINLPERVPEMMRRAFNCLRNGRPGPVMLEIPNDVALAEVDKDTKYRRPQRIKSAGDSESVAEAIRNLLKAKCPVLHVGQGVLYARATQELLEFAELAGVPVMTSLLGKSAFPENHKLAIGAGAQTATGALDHFRQKSDLVFGIGCSFSRDWMLIPLPSGKTIIQLTNDNRDLNADVEIDIGILGDAKLVLRQMIEELNKQTGGKGRDGSKIIEEIQALRKTWFKEWMPLLTSDEVPVNPYRVIWDLMNTVDRAKTIVTHDSGYVRDQLVPFYETTVPRGYLGWGNSTQMGHSMGLALGAKIGAPDKTVVNFTGDASFGMLGLEIETAARNKIPILTIILNNSVMCGAEHWLPVATDRYGMKYLTGNYAKVAAALGAASQRVEDAKEIIPSIQRAQEAMDKGQPALIEVITKEEQKVPKFW